MLVLSFETRLSLTLDRCRTADMLLCHLDLGSRTTFLTPSFLHSLTFSLSPLNSATLADVLLNRLARNSTSRDPNHVEERSTLEFITNPLLPEPILFYLGYGV